MSERAIYIDFDKDKNKIVFKINGIEKELKLTLWAAVSIEEKYGAITDIYKKALSPNFALETLMYIINAQIRIYNKAKNQRIEDTTIQEILTFIDENFVDINDSFNFCNAVQSIIIGSMPESDEEDVKKKATMMK